MKLFLELKTKILHNRSSVRHEDSNSSEGNSRKSVHCRRAIWLGLFTTFPFKLMWLRDCFLGRILTSNFFFLFLSSLLHMRLLSWYSLLSLFIFLRIFVFCILLLLILILRLLRRSTSLFIQVSLSLCLPLIISLAILSLWELILVAGLAHDAIALVHEP